jgi:hypothetical protein
MILQLNVALAPMARGSGFNINQAFSALAELGSELIYLIT